MNSLLRKLIENALDLDLLEEKMQDSIAESIDYEDLACELLDHWQDEIQSMAVEVAKDLL